MTQTEDTAKIIKAEIEQTTPRTKNLQVEFDGYGPAGKLDLFIDHWNYATQTKHGRAISDFCDLCGCTSECSVEKLIGAEVPVSDILRIMDMVSVEEPKKSVPIPTPTADTGYGRFVYVISCLNSPGPYCKIGIAASPEKRVQQLSTSSPFDLRLEMTRYFTDARAVEFSAHRKFASFRRNGEWFAMPAKRAIEYLLEAA